jgi:hypothetical protein
MISICLSVYALCLIGNTCAKADDNESVPKKAKTGKHSCLNVFFKCDTDDVAVHGVSICQFLRCCCIDFMLY